MKFRTIVRGLAVVSVLAVVAAACGSDSGGGDASGSASASGGSSVDCATVELGCAEYAAGAPIRVGTLLAISGDTATLGQDSQNGVKLAIDYLDGTFDGTPGQLVGHDVELQNEDDLCSKEGGQTGSTKLASDPTILAVVGTSCSSSAYGVADKILSAKGMPLISPSNTAAGLTAVDTHQPFYARTAQNDAIQAKVVADFVYSELGLKNAATIHDESPYAEGLTSGFKTFYEQQGGKVTAAEAIESTETDFKPLLTSIAQTNPDLIYLPDFNPACALIAKQALDIPDLAGVKLMGSDGCLASTFIDQAGDAAKGFYMSGPIPSPGGTTSDLLKTYNAAYKDQFGAPTASFNTNAFDAFNLIAQAVTAVAIENSDGSVSIPRQAMMDAILGTSDYAGISGTLTCNETGDCQSVATVNIGVYTSPEVPIEGGNLDAKPIFNEELTLAQALGG